MKDKVIYECKECGSRSPRWAGRCPNCGAWNSFTESVEHGGSKHTIRAVRDGLKPVRLGDVSPEDNYRVSTGIGEFDRVLGGGIIPGSLVLIGGDPGIGKSTLMLQMCGRMAGQVPLYVTGEESLQQIRYRSMRLSGVTDELLLLAENNIEKIDQVIKMSNPDVVVIDSIQSVYTDKIDATPGSVAQVRECASLLMQTAKRTNVAIFIIGHVTKDGVIAGPKILEHMVDTVLQFEGEKMYSYRILRSQKNRFGSTNELGIFDMDEEGLKEVLNPSEVFLTGRTGQESGIAIVASMEGTRPILLEVQALVTPTSYGVPQRSANGFDMRRLQMIIAVLEKRLGVAFRQSDVFVNVAGGFYLNDTSVDLGVAAALVSSLRDVPVDTGTVLIGEIGLTGEVRSVSFADRRIAEAEKLGFGNVILPRQSFDKLLKKFDINLTPVDRIVFALQDLL